jgi:polyisoprenoid-binding protein YceI
VQHAMFASRLYQKQPVYNQGLGCNNFLKTRSVQRMNYAALCALLGITGLASASPVAYTIDPNHTHPEFEADHLGGVSIWRGLFKRTSGTIILDAAAQTGTLDVAIDVASVEFGNDKLNEEAVNSAAPPIFEVRKYPTAYYKGTLGGFINGSPTTVAGSLTLHGITKPVALRIDSFKCVVDLPATQKHVCGADAVGTFNRADFGITIGQRYGFKMDVTLHIQVEAIQVE